jgi:hypothetical protein
LQYAFPILKKIILPLKILSYIIGGLGLIIALIILFGSAEITNKWASLGVLFLSSLYAIGLLVVSEVLRLLLAIREDVIALKNELAQSKPVIR